MMHTLQILYFIYSLWRSRPGAILVRNKSEPSVLRRFASWQNTLPGNSPGECNPDNRFLLKAHFPVFQHEPLEETSQEYLNWWKKFDRVLWVQRNPFDAIFSLWNMMEMLESFQRGENLVCHIWELCFMQFGTDNERCLAYYLIQHEARVDLPGGKLSWDNEKHRTKVFHLSEFLHFTLYKASDTVC